MVAVKVDMMRNWSKLLASVTIAKILEDNGGNVKLTIFPDGDHFCWGRVYDDQAVWDWLLAQCKL